MRPVYVGTGECGCGLLDMRLYHVPNTVIMTHAVCGRCLERLGFSEPEVRTAENIVDVDGQLIWKTDESIAGSERLDLGHGHRFEALHDREGALIGWLHTHQDAQSTTGVLCQSLCAIRPINGAPVHQVLCTDPLTLTPSLECRTCHAHGNVTNGQWEPC